MKIVGTLLGILLLCPVFSRGGTRTDDHDQKSYTLRGFVRDVTPDLSRASYLRFAELASRPGPTSAVDVTMSDEDISFLREYGADEQSAGASILVSGEGIRTQVVANSRGDFEVTGLKMGDYEVQADATARYINDSDHTIAVGETRVSLPVSEGERTSISLIITAYPAVIEGLVVDSTGRPLPDMKVTGLFYQGHGNKGVYGKYRQDDRATRFTTTDAEGRYRLDGLIPWHPMKITEYMTGGGMPSYMIIEVEREGYRHEKEEEAEKIPLITEEMVPAARRLMWLLMSLSEYVDAGKPMREAVELPPSSNHVIFAETIVMKKSKDGEEGEGAAHDNYNLR